MKHRTRTALALAGCVAVLAACSTEDPDASGNGGGGEGGVQTGPGVTDDTISVGVLTDLSGPFKAASGGQLAVLQAYWQSVNEDGGVCGRDVEVVVQDHGYDPQRAVALYRSMAPDVAALQQVLGSPILPAVQPLAEQDDLYIGGIGWASSALPFPNVQMPGAPYSIESANAIDYLVDELGLSEGDSVGVVHTVGDYGDDSLAGAEYAAEERGLEIVGQETTPTETDLSAQAAALKDAGVEAVILAGTPAHLASLAGVLASQGVDVPVFGHLPTWTSTLLDSPAGPALRENFHVLMASAPYNSEEPGPQAAAEAVKATAPELPESWEVPLAWGEGILLHTALQNACDAGDLTPAGIVAGMRQTADLDTEGIFAGPLDFSEVGQPATRATYLSRPDDTVPGVLRLEATLEGPSAEGYSYN